MPSVRATFFGHGFLVYQPSCTPFLPFLPLPASCYLRVSGAPPPSTPRGGPTQSAERAACLFPALARATGLGRPASRDRNVTRDVTRDWLATEAASPAWRTTSAAGTEGAADGDGAGISVGIAPPFLQCGARAPWGNSSCSLIFCAVRSAGCFSPAKSSSTFGLLHRHSAAAVAARAGLEFV